MSSLFWDDLNEDLRDPEFHKQFFATLKEIQTLRVGFTGTRKGMTDEQKQTVLRLLYEFAPAWCHHGDCVGADADFHHLARRLHTEVKIHPPSNPKLRAHLIGDDIAPEKPYLIRDRDIVEAADVVIAAPDGVQEKLKSGTWYTIRYARQLGKRTIIVWPDGSIED